MGHRKRYSVVRLTLPHLLLKSDAEEGTWSEEEVSTHRWERWAEFVAVWRESRHHRDTVGVHYVVRPVAKTFEYFCASCGVPDGEAHRDRCPRRLLPTILGPEAGEDQ